MGKRCEYKYKSGDQCVYTGCDERRPMCPAHAMIERELLKRETKRAADKEKYAKEGMPFTTPKKRPVPEKPVSTVQSVRQIIHKVPPAPALPPLWCVCKDPKVDNWQQCTKCWKKPLSLFRVLAS